MDNNQQSKSGFSFADDLMVDITGALFPGLLFLVILFVGVVIPILIYDDGTLLESCQISGSAWWVALIVLLIVSYVIGHAFFRADIIEPDKRDIRRRISEEIKKSKKKYRSNPSFDEVEAELRDQILAFRKTLKLFLPNPLFGIQPLGNLQQNDTVEFYSLLMRYCIRATDKSLRQTSDYPSEVLGVLFPEEVRRQQERKQVKTNDDITFNDLTPAIQSILNEYRRRICGTKHKVQDEATLKLIVCACVLNIQSELGSISEKNCSFPYVYYHKYLLKRNLLDYLDEVTWNADNTRSKNVINNYKTEIQLFAPEGYALVRKNEAHIRMSSSTRHMAQPLKWITGLTSFVMFLALFFNYPSCKSCSFCCLGIYTTFYGSLISFLLPFSIFLFLFFIQHRITHFIHYQRMREIFYTISIYDDYKEIIADKKKVKTNQINYNVNIH